MNALFTIKAFERDEDSNILTVSLEKNTCYIPLHDFEKWLKRTDRLYWEHNYSDHTGEHCQECGEYTIDQYWEMGDTFIRHDIYDFIVIHFVNPFKNLSQSLTQIFNSYAKQSATTNLVRPSTIR